VLLLISFCGVCLFSFLGVDAAVRVDYRDFGPKTSRSGMFSKSSVTTHKFATTIQSTKALDQLKLDYIFVDEISMVPEKFYKFFISMKRVKPNLKFIVVGDFGQFLPVKDRVEGCDYMGSCALWELCDGQRLQLTTFRRGKGRELYNIISNPEKLKQVKATDFNKQFTERHLCFTNAKRKWVNSRMMEREEKKASRNNMISIND
jgi:hypothetical protein